MGNTKQPQLSWMLMVFLPQKGDQFIVRMVSWRFTIHLVFIMVYWITTQSIGAVKVTEREVAGIAWCIRGGSLLLCLRLKSICGSSKIWNTQGVGISGGGICKNSKKNKKNKKGESHKTPFFLLRAVILLFKKLNLNFWIIVMI